VVVKEVPIDPKDIRKLMNNELTVNEYAKKYDMNIDHVKNFKRLYSAIDEIGDTFAEPEEEQFIVETFQNKFNKIRTFAKESSAQIVERVEEHPKESTVVALIIGITFAVLIGVFISKRK
jgi:hypothetical protein